MFVQAKCTTQDKPLPITSLSETTAPGKERVWRTDSLEVNIITFCVGSCAAAYMSCLYMPLLQIL